MVLKLSRSFNLLSASFAFVIWGSWAYFMNYQYGFYAGMLAGLIQGTASFIITLFLVHAVTYLFSRFTDYFCQLFLPAIITVTCTGTCLASIHALVGTPAIFHTITPAITVAFFFCVFTAIKLLRTQNTPIIDNES